jgi:hypothetical protein
MVATVHILWGPSGSGKTRRLCDVVRDTDATPGTTVWLVPSYRAADAAATASRLRCRRPLAAVAHLPGLCREIIRTNDAAARRSRMRSGGCSSRRSWRDCTVAENWTVWPGDRDTRVQRGGLRPARGVEAARGLALAPPRRPWRCGRTRHGVRASIRSFSSSSSVIASTTWRANLVRRRSAARGMRQPFEHVRRVVVDGFAGFTRTQRPGAARGGVVDRGAVDFPARRRRLTVRNYSLAPP